MIENDYQSDIHRRDKTTHTPPLSTSIFFFTFLIFCFLLLPFTLRASKAKKIESKNPKAILQKEKVFYKDHVPKKSKKATNDETRELVLDEYKEIKNLYACDPITQKWVQIESFEIIRLFFKNRPLGSEVDWEAYINFWAYDIDNQIWHKVSLKKYLQQASTQINNDKDNGSSTMVTEKLVLLDGRSKTRGVVTEELLEELLGVHTYPITVDVNPQQERRIWSNFSFDFSVGTGVVFYENSLVNMSLSRREVGEGDDCFFVTETNEVYKPNWFYHTLDKVDGFDVNQIYQVEDSCVYQAKFVGKGVALPITLGIQYTFAQQFLVGAGREIVLNYTNKLRQKDNSVKCKELIMRKKWSAQGRWFARGGWYAFYNPKQRLFADIRLFCVHHLGSELYKTLTFGPYLYRAFAYNIGLGYERQLTGILSFTSRISMELQPFKQFPNKRSYNIAYTQSAIYMQMGLSIWFSKPVL